MNNYSDRAVLLKNKSTHSTQLLLNLFNTKKRTMFGFWLHKFIVDARMMQSVVRKKITKDEYLFLNCKVRALHIWMSHIVHFV